MPLVSICIPTYNHTEYLKRTFDSIQKQSFKDYEIIITDDSPSSIVKDLVDQYDFNGKCQYYHNDNSLGSPENWNYCIGKATGKYVKIMHHDDWFSNEHGLKRFVETIEDTGADIIFSNCYTVNVKSNVKGEHKPGAENISKLKKDPTTLFLSNYIGAPSMIMYRPDSSISFDKNLKWLVDVDFYINYFTRHRKFAHINENLITVVGEADHSVTSGSYNNKQVEVFENFYLYNKLRQQLTLQQSLSYSRRLLGLLQRFNISSFQEIRDTGYNGKIPSLIKILLPLLSIKPLRSLLNKFRKSQ